QRHTVKEDGHTLLQRHENVEQGVGVLAARKTHHHLVAVLNHVEVGNGACRFAYQPLAELVRVNTLAFRSAAIGGFIGGGRRSGEGFCFHDFLRVAFQRLRWSSMPTAAQSENASGLLTRMRIHLTSGNSPKMRSTSFSDNVSSK